MQTLTTNTAAAACCAGCAATDQENDTALAIACTLDAGNFKARVASIRDLSRRSLRASLRAQLQLHLTYDADASAEVEALVRQESECCPFLEFDLQHDSEVVTLSIKAPISALAAADELFAHFAPELAREAA